MKVLHVLNELKFSGAEIMYVAAAEEFGKLGCELYVVNTAPHLGEYATYFANAGYKVLHWPYRPVNLIGHFKYMQEVISYLKKEKVDVLHIHRSDFRWLMSYCAWRANIKSVYTFHNVFSSNWYSYPLHLIQRWCAKSIFKCTFQTISDSVYNNERNYYHNETIKVYNWYDLNRFSPTNNVEDKRDIRNLLNISHDALVIISVGGCSHIKRHSDILRALVKVVIHYPNTVYLHLGDGHALQEEITLAKELNLEKHVRFEGNKADVRPYLIASDIYLMPSKFEGIPITTIEAMACKIPSILYNVPGLRDFNKNSECVVLINEDYNTLALAILELVQNPSKQKSLTEKGALFVNENFNMTTNVRRIFNLYSK